MPRSTINGTAIDLDGKEMILDADQDTTLTVDTDDRVDIKVAGSDTVHVTSTGLGIGTNSPSTKLTITESSVGDLITVTGANSTDLRIGNHASNNGGMYINSQASSDDLRFRTQGTDCMIIDATGYVTKPLQTYFRVRKNANQSNFATGTNVVVTWETEDFDVGSNFASNTFTAPVTGVYLFHLSLRLDQLETASNYFSASINTSNREYRWIEHFPDIGDKSYFTVQVTAIIDMDASDTADARIYQHSSTQQTDVTEDSTRTLFYGYLLG